MSNSVYSKDYKEIIERLKKARAESGLSQQEVADKLGKPQSFLSKERTFSDRDDVESHVHSKYQNHPFPYYAI